MVSEEPVDFLDDRGRFQHSHDPPDESFVYCFGVLRGSVLGIAFGFVGKIVGQLGCEWSSLGLQNVGASGVSPRVSTKPGQHNNWHSPHDLYNQLKSIHR